MSGGKCFTLAKNWYAANGEKLIPKTDEYQKLFTHEVELVDLGTNSEQEFPGNIFAAKKLIPLFCAHLAGLSQEFMVEVVKHHDVSAYKVMRAFNRDDNLFIMHDGSRVNSISVLKACLCAVEKAKPDSITHAYESVEDDYTLLIDLMTSARSRQNWPSSKLMVFQQAMAGERPAPRNQVSSKLHSFFESVKGSEYLPHDDKGPRYDWFLGRSGMLQPGVTRKTLGYFTLWEDLIHMASSDASNTAIQDLMQFCIHEAPEAMRAPIFNGLQSMMLDSSEDIADSGDMMRYMQASFKGTWLEPLNNSAVMQINMIGSLQPAAHHVAQNPEGFTALLDSRETIMARVYGEIQRVPAHLISLGHYSALRYATRDDASLPEQVLDPKMNRESFIAHLVRGLSTFIGNGGVEFEERDEIESMAVEGFKTAVKYLCSDKEIDYSVFKGMSSQSTALLISAGLDMKRLPAMNNRDKGRTLEAGLGL